MRARWVFILVSPTRLYVPVHLFGVHRTCRRAGEIELTAIGVEVNGSWHVPHAHPSAACNGCARSMMNVGGGQIGMQRMRSVMNVSGV